MSTCERCDQRIVFYKSAASGKPTPLDPLPVDIGGNVYLEDGLCHVLKKGDTHPGPLFLTHFATCPARTTRAPATSVLADPLASVKRIRREIEEERATKQADDPISDQAVAAEEAQLDQDG